MCITNIYIRVANKEEIREIIEWSVQEGWSAKPGDEDFYSILDPEGYFLLVGTENEKPVKIGAIYLVRLNASLSWIGGFIVQTKYRNKRYGSILWDYAMQKIQTPTVGLYAVPRMVGIYNRSSFNTHYYLQRWSTVGIRKKYEFFQDCVAVDTLKVPNIMAYSSDIFSELNHEFWSNLFKSSQVSGLILHEDNKIVGLGVIRPCTEGYRVGPLYADNLNGAEKLLSQLLNAIDTVSPVVLDVPSENKFCAELMRKFGLICIPDQDTVAMFKGDPRELIKNLDRNYAVFSLDVG